MDKNKNPLLRLIRGTSGPKLNQRVSIFAHKGTKRNRSRGDKKRNAMREAVDE